MYTFHSDPKTCLWFPLLDSGGGGGLGWCFAVVGIPTTNVRGLPLEIWSSQGVEHYRFLVAVFCLVAELDGDCRVWPGNDGGDVSAAGGSSRPDLYDADYRDFSLHGRPVRHAWQSDVRLGDKRERWAKLRAISPLGLRQFGARTIENFPPWAI